MTLKKLMYLLAIAAGFTAALHVSDSLTELQTAQTVEQE